MTTIQKMIKEDNLGDTNKLYLTVYEVGSFSVSWELQKGTEGRKLW